MADKKRKEFCKVEGNKINKCTKAKDKDSAKEKLNDTSGRLVKIE